MTFTDRYRQLLDQIPGGTAYASEGYVLPFLDRAHQFLYETDAPNTTFGVFLDSEFRFTIQSDAQGVALVELPLPVGPHVIEIENDDTQARFRSYVTIRDYAVWYAAYAEQLAALDTSLDSEQVAQRLLTSDARFIEEVHGRLLDQPNSLSYVTDAYRTVLQGLRQAYRQFGAKTAGLNQVVESFTNVTPFLVPLSFLPVWYLGNPWDFTWSTTGPFTLPNINAITQDNIATLTDAQVSPASITQPIKAGTIRVVFDGAWSAGAVRIDGTAPDASVITETVPAAPGTTAFTTRSFASITSITNLSPVGVAVGSATIGDGGGFVTINSVEGPINTTPTLYYRDVGGVPHLSTSLTSPFTPVPGSGDYEIGFHPGARVLNALNTENYTFNGEDRRLYLNVNDRGRLVVQMPTSGSETAAQVRDRINTAANAHPSYGVDIAVAQADDTVAITTTNLNDTLGFIRLEEGPSNAARTVFGVPRLSAQAPAAIPAGSTALTPVTSELTNIEPPFKVRIGRNGESSTVLYNLLNGTVANASGRFAELSYPGTGYGDYMQIGDAAEIVTVANGNDGFHTVVGRVDADTVLIRHEDLAGTFTNTAGTEETTNYILGEINEATAVDTGTGELTLANPTTREYNQNGAVDNSSWQIEVLELPYQTTPRVQLTNQGKFLVTVDQDYIPPSDTSDALSLTRSNLPDGWLSNAAAVTVDQYGYMEPFRLVLSEGATDLTFERTFPVEGGLPYRVTFWVQTDANPTCQYAINIDGDTGANQTINFVPRQGENVQQVTRVFNTASTTESVRVQLEHTTGTAGDITVVEKVALEPALEPSLFLDRGTVVRSQAPLAQDRLLYYWSPDQLTGDEDAAVNRHLEQVQPAHVRVGAIDVSEYDVSGDPVNVIGVFDDADWLNATLVNMEVVPQVPGRLTYARPDRLSSVVDETLTVDGLGQATLTEPTTNVGPFPQVPNTATLLRKDGIPVPNTATAAGVQPYVFLTNQQIDIDPTEIAPGATYTIDYDALIQAETPVLDLGASSADYLWLTTIYAWRRVANTLGERSVTRGVTFDAQFRATLDASSDQDKNTSVLFENGVEVNDASWEYIDSQTIQINSSVFNADAVYSLEYSSLFNSVERVPTFVLEHRAAASSAAVSGVAYTTIGPNEFVNNTLQYHQLRVSFSGVDDLNGLRLHGLGLRGINPSNATGIVLP